MTKPGSREREAGLSFDYFLRQRASSFRRTLAASAVLSIIVIAAVSSALAWRQYQRGQRSAANDLKARVVVAAAVVDAAFAGQISTLTAIASAPAVIAQNRQEMRAYFKRLQTGGPFNGGLGWIDAKGEVQVSSSGVTPGTVNLSDRAYVRKVLATGKPYISAGLVGKGNGKQVIVSAVATRDRAGRISGVLAGSIRVKALGQNKSAFELGYAGLSIVDRTGQQLFSQLAPVENTQLLKRIQGRSGVLTGVDGLTDQGGRVVAFSGAPVPAWTIVIDRPAGAVYAAARRALVLELASVAAATFLVLVLLGFVWRRSRRQTIAADARARAWSGLTRTLASAATPEDVAEGLIASLIEAFPDGLPVISLLLDDGAPRIRSPLGGTWSRVTADESALAQVALYTQERRRNVRLEREPRLFEVHRLSGRRLRWLNGLPVSNVGGDSIGSLALVTPTEPLGAGEWELLTSFAEQVAQAVERTLLYEREHDLAVSLQHSLLPEALPSIDGVDLAGHYAAGGTGVEVGGDWYDAIRRPDGIVHLSVGDVIGKGIGAAVLMGRHRNAFRAYAYECASPAEIVRRMIRHVDSDEMIITVACVSFDPYTRELTYACAGHLPPLLIDAELHSVTRLDGASSPPLGVAEAQDITEARLGITGPTTLVMYTDGLIERRGHNIDEGIELLANVFTNSENISVDSTLRVVVDALGPPTDDVALLVARLAHDAERFDVEMPARPEELAALRRRLTAWLTARGLASSETAEIVLAVSEACNNAIEHAYNHHPGEVSISAGEYDGVLRIIVQDRGSWRPESKDELRGRGISIMQTLMQNATIETTARGTRVVLERAVAADPAAR